MSTIGTIAPNFHEGTRSEYLAQYVFSAFGTSIPAPHPEDAGIDLYCTLGERIGQRLHVQNYYFVQVKSQKQEIRFEGDKAVEWALSHRYPLLICYLNKKSGRIEIYQTLKLTMCHAKRGIKSLTLIPNLDPLAKVNIFDDVTPSPDLRLYLHHPILDFKISQMLDEEFANSAMLTLKSWIELDQENISFKPAGVSLFRVPMTYQTNSPLGSADRIVGNVKDGISNQLSPNKYHDFLFRLLTPLVHQAAIEKNPAKFQPIADFVGKLIANLPLHYSTDLLMVAAAVNTGAKYAGYPCKIELTQNGKKMTPMLKIK